MKIWEKTNAFRKVCYVVVTLREGRAVPKSQERRQERLQMYVYRESGIYNHSGDDGKEDPPVPIPNTEVKLFYAESTYG